MITEVPVEIFQFSWATTAHGVTTTWYMCLFCGAEVREGLRGVHRARHEEMARIITALAAACSLKAVPMS